MINTQEYVAGSSPAPCWKRGGTLLTYGSVCSGAGTCALAFLPLGIKAAWFCEFSPAPSAVLAHHWPNVPNLGDMTTLPDRILSREIPAPDIFMGGTPCQAFSVAGKRLSLDDRRGNLTLTFVEIANAIDTVRSAEVLAFVLLKDHAPDYTGTPTSGDWGMSPFPGRARAILAAIRAGAVPGVSDGSRLAAINNLLHADKQAMDAEITDLKAKLTDAVATIGRLGHQAGEAEQCAEKAEVERDQLRADLATQAQNHGFRTDKLAADLAHVTAERDASTGKWARLEAEIAEAKHWEAHAAAAMARARQAEDELSEAQARKFVVTLPAKASADSLFSDKDKALWGGAINACAAAIVAAGGEVNP